MPTRHKNKTFATFLAFTLGGLGIHRFYLYGWKDIWAWVHASSIPLFALALVLFPEQPLMFVGSPLVISVLAGFIETFVIGLLPDEKWDAKYNLASGKLSNSGWPVVILIVLTMGVGATALIATLARTFDLLYTGGSYG